MAGDWPRATCSRELLNSLPLLVAMHSFASVSLIRPDRRLRRHGPVSPAQVGSSRMTMLRALLAGAGSAVLALSVCTASFAQNKPGVPGGVLQDQFRFNEHPQMQFAASAPDAKYQSGPPDERRRRADRGDASGDACNLKCGNN
jgi:DNA-binding transcriptional LysR family regulator